MQCLVSFELVFPPSFFNIMTHVLVHLCEEINILGPVFLHNMFPFERFMGVLKKYVNNRARPDLIPNLKPIGVPESRHKGRLEGKKHARRASNNMYGRAFSHPSTLHSSTKFCLGGSVDEGT